MSENSGNGSVSVEEFMNGYKVSFVEEDGSPVGSMRLEGKFFETMRIARAREFIYGCRDIVKSTPGCVGLKMDHSAACQNYSLVPLFTPVVDPSLTPVEAKRCSNAVSKALGTARGKFGTVKYNIEIFLRDFNMTDYALGCPEISADDFEDLLISNIGKIAREAKVLNDAALFDADAAQPSERKVKRKI